MEHSTSHSLAARYCVWTLAQSPIGSKSRLTHNTRHKSIFRVLPLHLHPREDHHPLRLKGSRYGGNQMCC